MAEQDQPVVVIGATGRQGGAVLDSLLDHGVAVRAVVRDTQSRGAQGLAARGVDVVPGDLNSATSLSAILAGAAAAFAMTTFAGPAGVDGEVEHGRRLAQAVEQAALPYLVYSSVGGADRGTGVPHFESKYCVEQFLLDAGPVAFVRPTFFMENLLSLIHRGNGSAQLSMPLPADVPLQMVSVRTIGAVAAAYLINRPPAGSAIEIAGDELTGTQMAAHVAKRLRLPTRYVREPLSILGDDDDSTAMWEWFTEKPAYKADFDGTRALAGTADTLPQWLLRHFG